MRRNAMKNGKLDGAEGPFNWTAGQRPFGFNAAWEWIEYDSIVTAEL